MIRAHGGSKDIISTQRGGGLILGGIVRDTMVNSPKAIHMKSLENLVAQTTGVPREKPLMDGVIASTVPASMRTTPELHPVHEENKSDSKMAVGGTYAGKVSGYAQAGKSKAAKKHK